MDRQPHYPHRQTANEGQYMRKFTPKGQPESQTQAEHHFEHHLKPNSQPFQHHNTRDTRNTYPTQPTHSAESIVRDIIDHILERCVYHITTDVTNFIQSRKELVDPKGPGHNSYSFRLMSYNILAPSLAELTTQEFWHFDQKYLEWENRAAILLQEIKFHSPDILCLQEVDKSDKTLLSALGQEYEMRMKFRTGDKQDGLAILYKRSKFELVEYKFLEFNLPGAMHPLVCKENVSMFMVLEIKSTVQGHKNKLIIVGNIHVLFNDNRGDIKTTQIYLAMKALYELCQRYADYDKMLFLGGDFNTIPNSAMYSWLHNGDFDFSEIQARQMSGQKKASWSNSYNFNSTSEYAAFNINHYKYNQKYVENRLDLPMAWITALKSLSLHVDDDEQIKIMVNTPPLGESNPKNMDPYYFNFHIKTPVYLRSAYASFQKYCYHSLRHGKPQTNYKPYSTYENLFTTCSVNGAMTVDYIWFGEKPSKQNPKSYHKLRVTRVVEMPILEDLAGISRKFPHKFFPSDHFSLIVDFTFEA